MMPTALPVALLGLTLAALPLAFAQEDNATRPDDAAWVEDCPPDMMCAADASCAEGETCDDTPREFGPEGCIECSQPPSDQAGTCMDGEQAGEACRDDVQYMAPPGEAPTTTSVKDASADAKDKIPAPSLLAALGIVGVAALAVSLLGRR